MKRKLLSILLAVTAACISLTSCTSNPAKNNASDLEEISIVLDWYPNAVHAFIYEAIEKGYYEAEGLKVNIRFPSNPNDALSLPAAQKADIGIYYLKDIIMAKVNETVPIKVIGTVVQKPLNIVLSLEEQNITFPADLVGKKIGYGGSVLAESVIETMIQHVGASVDDIQVVDVGFDLMNSMTTKNVDATIECLVNHEVPQMENQGLSVNYFFPTDYGVPDYYELVLVTGEQQLSQDSEKLTRFLRASKKGFQDMKENPEEAIRILLKYQNEENFPLTESVERQSLDYLLPVMETDDCSFLTQEEGVWNENINWLYEKGLIPKKIDARDILVSLYYE